MMITVTKEDSNRRSKIQLDSEYIRYIINFFISHSFTASNDMTMINITTVYIG